VQAEPDAAEQMKRSVAIPAHEGHGQQVEEPAEVALRAVPGASMPTGAMVDRDLCDAEAAIRGEDRDEAVQLPVDPHSPQHLCPVGLETAVDIVQTDARDDRRRPVEPAREEPPEERVVPVLLPTRDEVEPLVELGEQMGNLRGIVLEVGVEGQPERLAGAALRQLFSNGDLDRLVGEIAERKRDPYSVVDAIVAGARFGKA